MQNFKRNNFGFLTFFPKMRSFRHVGGRQEVLKFLLFSMKFLGPKLSFKYIKL